MGFLVIQALLVWTSTAFIQPQPLHLRAPRPFRASQSFSPPLFDDNEESISSGEASRSGEVPAEVPAEVPIGLTVPQKVELGLELSSRGDIEGAVACLQEAAHDDPNSWSAHWHLGKMLYLLRHKSDRFRSMTEDAFLNSMLLRPDRMRVDCGLVTGSDINDVFADFENKSDDVSRVRSMFKSSGFDAPGVRRKFGLSGAPPFGIGVMLAKRLAGRPDSELTGLPQDFHSMLSSRSEPPEYESKQYWDERYSSSVGEGAPSYDWLLAFDDVRDTLESLIQPACSGDSPVGAAEVPVSVLVLGCGDSDLSAAMSNHKWQSGVSVTVVSVDYSEPVIAKQRAAHPDLDWRVLDVLDLVKDSSKQGGRNGSRFEENQFDIVIDKSMIDMLKCVDHAAGSGNESVIQMLRGVSQVLKPGGRLVGWSLHDEADVRTVLEAQVGWSVATGRVRSPKFADAVSSTSSEDSAERTLALSQLSQVPKVSHTAFVCVKNGIATNPTAPPSKQPPIVGALSDDEYNSLLAERRELIKVGAATAVGDSFSTPAPTEEVGMKRGLAKGFPIDPLDVLVRLFVVGLAVEAFAVEGSLGADAVGALSRLGMLTECPPLGPECFEGKWLMPLVAVTPLDVPVNEKTPATTATKVSGDAARVRAGQKRRKAVWIATDWPPPVSASLTEEPVMYLGPDSIALLRHLPATANTADKARGGGRWLDLCCGSGVQGVVAASCGFARHRVDLVDVNPRAVRFAKFNAKLNRVASRCTVYQGDLYKALPSSANKNKRGQAGASTLLKPNASNKDLGTPRQRYACILANPPFVPVPPALNEEVRRYDVFAGDPSGRGDGVLQEILIGAPQFLEYPLGDPLEGSLEEGLLLPDDEGGDTERGKGTAPDGPEAKGAHQAALQAFIDGPLLGRSPSSPSPSLAQQQPTLVILRGVSGSGKSTVALRIAAAVDDDDDDDDDGGGAAARRKTVLCSADSFFMDASSGEYKFQPKRLPQAHASCLQLCKDALRNLNGGGGVVVVDNTNTKRWEYAKYEAAATKFGARVLIVEVRHSGKAAAAGADEDKGDDKDEVSSSSQIALCAARNVHGVPLAVVRAMAERWEVDARATTIPMAGEGSPLVEPQDALRTTRPVIKTVPQAPPPQSSSSGSGGGGGGVVAVVTELPNAPNYAEHVLRPLVEEHWVQAMVASDQGGGHGAEALKQSTPASRFVVSGVVVHDDPPSSAEKYALRRAGQAPKRSGKEGGRGGKSDEVVPEEGEGGGSEVRAWRAHLEKEGIASVSNSMVFLRVHADLSVAGAQHQEPGLEGGGTMKKTHLETHKARRAWSAVDLESHTAVCCGAKTALEL